MSIGERWYEKRKKKGEEREEEGEEEEKEMEKEKEKTSEEKMMRTVMKNCFQSYRHWLAICTSKYIRKTLNANQYAQALLAKLARSDVLIDSLDYSLV